MPKFNTAARMPPRRRGPIQTTNTPARTFNWGVGYLRDPKSELFLLALSNMASESTFYETAQQRDDRFEKLIATVVSDDPEWVQRFIPWLRREANMRSAAIVLACEYVRAGGPNGARVVNSAISRADEPAEVVSYWLAKYGRRSGEAVLPYGIKRGVARAATRLYTETNAIKYDGQNQAMHFGDVILLTRPKPKDEAQNQLFRYLRYRWHDKDKNAAQFELLQRLAAREAYERIPMSERRAALRDWGIDVMPWEQLAGWLPGGMDAEAWEAVIPYMGIFALTRNLRNFDQAGISARSRQMVAAELKNEDVIARSHMFPMRFFAAWQNVQSLHWGGPLETALQYSVKNVPALPGRTLILVDRSGSMMHKVSARSELTNADAAALFGSVLAIRAEQPTLIQYGGTHSRIPVAKGDAVLRLMSAFGNLGSTETMQTLRSTYAGHDRVVILTDEQADFGPIPDVKAPIYTFNLVGYQVAHLESGTHDRYTFGGGLSDATFTLLSVLEQRKSGAWPF